CRKTQSMSLLGVKRTCLFALQMSAFDPKRTSGPPFRNLANEYALVARRLAGWPHVKTSRRPPKKVRRHRFGSHRLTSCVLSRAWRHRAYTFLEWRLPRPAQLKSVRGRVLKSVQLGQMRSSARVWTRHFRQRTRNRPSRTATQVDLHQCCI